MTNPLLSPSTLPYGLPPFADIDDAHYAEAVEAGLAEHLAEIQAIVDTPAAPTFENTALAMERSGRLLDRAAASFFTLVSADASDAIRDLETRLSPLFAAHQDAVYLNRGLYERFAALDADQSWTRNPPGSWRNTSRSSGPPASSSTTPARSGSRTSTPSCPGSAPSSASASRRA